MSEHHHNDDYLDVKREEEDRADQNIDDVVASIEARGEQADTDYYDDEDEEYHEDIYAPLPIFAEQPTVSSSRKRKPQNPLSANTSQVADSVLGEEIDQEQPDPNSVSVILSGVTIVLPCSRRFDTGPGKFIAGTSSVPADFPKLPVFSASDIPATGMPLAGLYDDAGQVVLRNMASRPSGVLNTSILQGRDLASKNRATADKQNNIKHVKMFSQFENKQGSPKMSNFSFGEAAVVRTSGGLRYLAADDRAMLGRDAQTLGVNIQGADWKYGKASSFPRLSLIDFPRPPVFGNYQELNNMLTEHAFVKHITPRDRTKPTEQGDNGGEQAATKKASKKPAKKSKKKAAPVLQDPTLLDDEENTFPPKQEEEEQAEQAEQGKDEQAEQGAGFGSALHSELLAAAAAAAAGDGLPQPAHLTITVPPVQQPESPIHRGLQDMFHAPTEAVLEVEEDLRTLILNCLSEGGSLLQLFAERGMLTPEYMNSVRERVARGELEHQLWASGVDQEIAIALNSVASAVALQDAWDTMHPVVQGDAVQEADSLTLENLTLRAASEQDSPTRLANEHEPVVPQNRRPERD